MCQLTLTPDNCVGGTRDRPGVALYYITILAQRPGPSLRHQPSRATARPNVNSALPLPRLTARLVP